MVTLGRLAYLSRMAFFCNFIKLHSLLFFINFPRLILKPIKEFVEYWILIFVSFVLFFLHLICLMFFWLLTYFPASKNIPREFLSGFHYTLKMVAFNLELPFRCRSHLWPCRFIPSSFMN